MAQFDCSKENSHSSSSSIFTESLARRFPASNFLITPTTKPREHVSSMFSPLGKESAQDPGVFTEGRDPLNRVESCSPCIDLRSDLRPVPLKVMWDLEKMIKLYKFGGKETPPLSPLDGHTEGVKGAAEPVEDDVLPASFQSKYIHIFPLYQDYCLRALKDDVNRVGRSVVSELITPVFLQGLESPLSRSSRSGSAALKQSPAEAHLTSSPTHPRRVTPFTLWQDLDEVKASGLLRSLTSRQTRLQECMFEVIGSEASYLKSLEVAVNHFCASKALKQTLSQREHHILFSNIRHVMAASEKFFMDLEMRLGEHVLICQVGDIVLKHCPEFHTLYVPYVTNMMYQEALLKQLLHQNKHFVNSLKKLENDPVCQRQSLKSFLVLPFQRITRVKLLLESILKLTEAGADSFSTTEKAIQAIHEIVTDCDNGVRQMKQIEELVCLKTLMDFGKVKSVPLVVSRRFLVHQGPMRQRMVESTSNSKVSFTNIYLHLFNDLLIISLKKDQRFKVVEHAEFPTHVHVENLKTEVLGLPPDSFLLRLSRSQTGHPTALILVAHTKSDKETWMKMLSQTHLGTLF